MNVISLICVSVAAFVFSRVFCFCFKFVFGLFYFIFTFSVPIPVPCYVFLLLVLLDLCVVYMDSEKERERERLQWCFNACGQHTPIHVTVGVSTLTYFPDIFTMGLDIYTGKTHIGLQKQRKCQKLRSNQKCLVKSVLYKNILKELWIVSFLNNYFLVFLNSLYSHYDNKQTDSLNQGKSKKVTFVAVVVV